MARFTWAFGSLLLVVACAGGRPGPGLSALPEASGETSSIPQTISVPSPSRVARSIPLCNDVPNIAAPASYYRDSPIYVANEMPTERLKAWAQAKPGFEEVWIDRDHHGWITLAFSSGAEARQRELETEFPDVGVVAVQVDWTLAELNALQRRVADELMPEFASGAGQRVTKGVVTIGVGPLTQERVDEVEARFAGDRVCLEGFDPELLPSAGPQQPAGDGWRLLAAQDETGQSYRTGIAFDDQSYETLWAEIGLVGDRPAVDFEAEVAVWFGAVHGSSCPKLRLDGVVADRDAALLFADIVLIDGLMACTADAIPHAYVVAVERSRLPVGPFAIQLDQDGPPPGAPEERTVIDVDLSAPGSVAQPGEVHGDASAPEPDFVGPGGFVEPDFPMQYRQSAHCGLEWLGPLNGVAWHTGEAERTTDWIPQAWDEAISEGTIQLMVTVETGPPPILTAMANGHEVEYRASAESAPGCD